MRKKNARILVFSDSDFPVSRQDGSFRPYTKKKIHFRENPYSHIFYAIFFCKEECNSSLHVTQPKQKVYIKFLLDFKKYVTVFPLISAAHFYTNIRITTTQQAS